MSSQIALSYEYGTKRYQLTHSLCPSAFTPHSYEPSTFTITYSMAALLLSGLAHSLLLAPPLHSP